MTGEQLIQWIQENHAEDYEFVVAHDDSDHDIGIHLEKYNNEKTVYV